jgi:hypothetical protein
MSDGIIATNTYIQISSYILTKKLRIKSSILITTYTKHPSAILEILNPPTSISSKKTNEKKIKERKKEKDKKRNRK